MASVRHGVGRHVGDRPAVRPGDGEISRQSGEKAQQAAGDGGPANPHRPPAAPHPRACRPALLLSSSTSHHGQSLSRLLIARTAAEREIISSVPCISIRLCKPIGSSRRLARLRHVPAMHPCIHISMVHGYIHGTPVYGFNLFQKICKTVVGCRYLDQVERATGVRSWFWIRTDRKGQTSSFKSFSHIFSRIV